MAATPDGGGYWLAAADGGVFTSEDRPLRRLARAAAPEQAHRGHGRHARRRGLLAGRLRRRGLHLGDAPFYGSTGGHPPQQADRGHGRHPRRQGLLAGRLRRRDLHLRRRRLLRLDRGASTSTSRSWAWPPPPTARATGWSPPTAGSSPSATPPSTARPGAMHLNDPIVGMAATPDGKGYWLVASDGGIFTFGDAPFYGSTGAITSTADRRAWRPPPTATATGWSASDGGVFNEGTPLLWVHGMKRVHDRTKRSPSCRHRGSARYDQGHGEAPRRVTDGDVSAPPICAAGSEPGRRDADRR